MIIYTPLDLPKIEPDDWSIFWDIWNRYSAPLVKTSMNTPFSDAPVGAKHVWQGLDIYKKDAEPTRWQAPFYDIRDVLPNLYNTLAALNIDKLTRVRLLKSVIDIKSHTDDDLDRWSVRAFFYYPAEKQQWYFTKPGSQSNKKYITMPDDTNWFAYNDKHCWHGTDYDAANEKILLQLYYHGSTPSNLEILIEASKKKFTEHLMEI